nr:hypothetical protein [Microbacterium testaceum]
MSTHTRNRRAARGWRSERQTFFWAAAVVGGFVLFLSWFWFGMVVEDARSDAGQAGQAYADASVQTLGVGPVVTAHVVILAAMAAVGSWSRARPLTGLARAVAVCAASSIAGLLVSIPFFAPTQSLP